MIQWFGLIIMAQRAQAELIQKKLLDLCDEHGLWSTIKQEYKPKLKVIRVEITIKVDD